MSKQSVNKNGKNGKNPGKNSTFEKIMIGVIIAGIIIFVFINFAWPKLSKKTKEVAADKTVEVIVQNADKVSGGNDQIKDMLENLSEEDKKTVSEIIENHMDQETISELMGYVKNKDKESLMKYAAENLSASEILKLMEIYNKYSWPEQN